MVPESVLGIAAIAVACFFWQRHENRVKAIGEIIHYREALYGRVMSRTQYESLKERMRPLSHKEVMAERSKWHNE